MVRSKLALAVAFLSLVPFSFAATAQEIVPAYVNAAVNDAGRSAEEKEADVSGIRPSEGPSCIGPRPARHLELVDPRNGHGGIGESEVHQRGIVDLARLRNDERDDLRDGNAGREPQLPRTVYAAS